MAKTTVNLDGDDGDMMEAKAVAISSQDAALAAAAKRPICPVHWCLMIADATKRDTTYYRCKVDGCTARDSRPRNMIIPNEPTTCPNCQTPMVVDHARASSVFVRLQCSSCSFHVDVPKIKPVESRRRTPRDFLDI